MDASRVVQVVVERGAHSFFGSGYVVGPGRVLTAAHVLAGGARVYVRVDDGAGHEALIAAKTWWADPAGGERTDLGVICLGDQVGAGMRPARFGRVGDGAAAWLPVTAMGFPRFKYRDERQLRTRKGKGYRDLEQMAGTAPVAAN